MASYDSRAADSRPGASDDEGGERDPHEVLGVADVAAIMLHGKVEFSGAPAEVGPALDRAYLGGSVGA